MCLQFPCWLTFIVISASTRGRRAKRGARHKGCWPGPGWGGTGSAPSVPHRGLKLDLFAGLGRDGHSGSIAAVATREQELGWLRRGAGSAAASSTTPRRCGGERAQLFPQVHGGGSSHKGNHSGPRGKDSAHWERCSPGTRSQRGVGSPTPVVEMLRVNSAQP